MNKFYKLLAILLISVSIPAMAQHPTGRTCGTMDWFLSEMKNNPTFRAQYEENSRKTEVLMRQQIQQRQVNPSQNQLVTYIPIVFHVVLNSTQQAAYPDQLILRQLDSLNKDWAGLNSDSANIPAAFQSIRGHSTIQFCLAQRTPTGGATTGINRVTSTTVSSGPGGSDPIKSTAAGGSDAWDPTKYVNVWLGNFSSPSALGYASFPIGSPENPSGNITQQGVVVLAQSVPGGTATPFNKGRTLTHELGHFFWLRHINGDASCGNDFPTTTTLDDTPQQNNLTSGCPGQAPTVNTVASGCAASPNPPGRMFQNYMDYTDDACYSMFTNGQVARMDLAITNYRSTLLSSNGCLPPAGFTFGVTATVTSACPAASSLSGTITTSATGGYSIPITLAATTGVPAGVTVSFGTNPLTPGSSTAVTLSGTNNLSNGTYTITITGTATGHPVQTTTLTVTISAGTAPVISAQPSNQSLCIGQAGSFSVTASTGTFQWQLSTDGGTTWSNISGAAAASYAVTGAANLNNNQYRCVVTSQCGSTTSSAATLTVNPTTVISSQPTGLALCQGSSATFSVTAAGAGLTYQWEISTNSGSTWNPIPSANAASYVISSVATSDNNNQFRCTVTGTCGNVTSNAATLQVSANITISTQPTSQTVCEATTISFTSGAAGSGITYQWQVSTDGGTTYSNLSNGGVYSGATAATLTVTGVLPTQNGYRFRTVASNGTCTPGISNAATLSVNTFPSINTQPTSVTVCEGGNATFSVAATTGVGVLSYQWQFSTNGITYTNIPGATSSSYSITGAVVGQNNYVFRVIVTATCGSVNSALALLTVNPFPIVSFNPQSTICKSDNPITLSATPAGGTFSGSGVTGTTFNPTVAGVGAKAINYSVTVAGCTSSAVRTILVNECAERHLSIDKFPAIIVYPSPNQGNFNIGISTDIVSKLEIRIYNALGQMIKSQSASGLRYGSVIPVSIAGQPSGTYQVYMVNDENGKVTTKATSIVVYR